MNKQTNECVNWDNQNYQQPKVDIAETDQEVRIVAELPGVERDKVEISVEQQVLTLKSAPTAEDQQDKIARREFYLPGFQRRFRLPESLDQEQISANLKNGILAITIPRRPEEKPRQIKVKDN